MLRYLFLLTIPLAVFLASCEDSGTDGPTHLPPDAGQDSLAVVSTRPISAKTVRDGVVDSEASFFYDEDQLMRKVVVRPSSLDSDSIVTTYEYQGNDIIARKTMKNGTNSELNSELVPF